MTHPSLHIVQIAFYEEMNPIARKIAQNYSKFTKFGYVSLRCNRAVTCLRSPKFQTNVSNSEMTFTKSIQIKSIFGFLKAFDMVTI